MHAPRIGKQIIASAALAALAVAPSVAAGSAHAAPARDAAQPPAPTYVDPTGSYGLTYPADWTRTPKKGFDLFAQSSDQNLVIVSMSLAASSPSLGSITRDFPTFIKSVGMPLGKAKYISYKNHGVALRVGMSAYTNAQGGTGVVVMEEAYSQPRLCLVAGAVLDAKATTAKQDISDAVGVLTSIQLHPKATAPTQSGDPFGGLSGQ